MPMSPDAIADLEKLIKKARQNVLPFGLCLGKKPDDNVLVLHLKKTPEVLMRQAKQEGETGKVTCGQVSVSGKVMSLTLEGKMLPGLAKNMKTFMTKIGIKMKVVILDADGTELESDGDEIVDEDEADTAAETETDADTVAPSSEEAETAEASEAPSEPAAAAPPPPPPPPPPEGGNPQAAQWGKVSTALNDRVETFAASGDPKATAIAKAWEGAHTAAASGNYDVALAVAKKISPVIAAGPAAAPASEEAPTAPPPEAANAPSPDAEKWAKLEGPMGDLFAEVMKLDPPEATKMRAAWAMATESAEAGDHTKAIAIATRLKPMLDAAKKAGASAQTQEIPAGVVPFQKSKLAWEAARSKMKAEVGVLIKAIQDACAGDPELADIANEAKSLNDRLMEFDEGLEDALDEVINSPVGDGRRAAQVKAVQAIGQYRTLLQTDFFQDVDNNNGFAPVKVTETATKSLDAISKILEAQAKTAA